MKFFDAGYQKGIDEGEKTGLKDGQTKGYQAGYEADIRRVRKIKMKILKKDNMGKHCYKRKTISSW